MRVQHNIAAMGAYRNYGNNTNAINRNLEKLSSGYKINRAGDDAAGLAVSEKMRWQISGLGAAQQNCKDAIGMIQTAEGALTEVHSMLNRMYELSIKSANGTYSSGTDRASMQLEFNELAEEINRIGSTCNFNGQKLFATGADNIMSKNFAIGEKAGATNASGKAVNILSTSDEAGVFAMKSTGDKKTTCALNMNNLGFASAANQIAGAAKVSDRQMKQFTTVGGGTSYDYKVCIKSTDGAQKVGAVITQAINLVSMSRAKLGAYQNRMEHTMNSLSVMEENVQNAESNVRDTDVASEMTKYTKNNILLQSAQAMLAQANQQPQGVLQLLQ